MIRFDHDETLQRLKENGWIWLPKKSLDEAPAIIEELGSPIPDFRTGANYSELLVHNQFSAPRASMSSFVGTGEQPMHTDVSYMPVPPRYVALQCLASGENACPTHLWVVDSTRLFENCPSTLTAPWWVFHDRVHPAFYGSVVRNHRRNFMIRFDPFCMRAAESCKSTIQDVENTLRRYTLRLKFEWAVGDLLIFDNWLCLHARGAGADRAPSRRLRRWYIGSENGMGKQRTL